MMFWRLSLKKRFITILKVFSIVSILLLSVHPYTNGISTNACDDVQCQQCCTHIVQQHEAAIEKHSSVPPCCSGSQECSCHLSNGQIPGLPEIFLSFIRVEHRVSIENLIIETNDLSNNHLQKDNRKLFYAELTARSVPIYIQHLSLLC